MHQAVSARKPLFREWSHIMNLISYHMYYMGSTIHPIQAGKRSGCCYPIFDVSVGFCPSSAVLGAPAISRLERSQLGWSVCRLGIYHWLV